jgi:hypothetical protein
MTWIFAACSVVGGTVLFCQFVMTLVGLGHGFDDASGGHDVGHDIGHDLVDQNAGTDGHASGEHQAAHHQQGATWLFGVLTFRTVVAAITFFGLAGLAADASHLPAESTLVLALAAGAAAMYGVHWIMRTMSQLRADGTARIERSVGRPGSVYLRIPGNRSGVGKATVNLGDRTIEYQAVTAGDPLPTGARIVVTAVVNGDTVEVKAAQPALEPNHV